MNNKLQLKFLGLFYQRHINNLYLITVSKFIFIKLTFMFFDILLKFVLSKIKYYTFRVDLFGGGASFLNNAFSISSNGN
jgi:hypothetical protein